MVNTKFDRKALTEVYEVIIMLEKKDLEKIPNKIIETIKLNKDSEYDVNLQDIEDGKMLPDTVKILSTLYTYYLANEEEKNIIFKLVNAKQELIIADYPIFRKRKIDMNEENKERSLVVVKKDNFFKRILHKIRKFFCRE